MVNVKKIEIYLNRTLLGKIIKLNKNLIKNTDTLSVYYFYWWYKEMYNFKTIGICVRKKQKYNFNSLSFTLFFIIKNIRVNQVYLNTSPFITFMKKRNKMKKKLIKLLYIL
uniref:Uncharacterized protein n=1 Tax=Paramoeba pemaquidensis TaxID=180228 RepID=A0A1D8D5I7_9EUKA|nr:hypothetical protein [Paramoeba pemaquidensis]AOS85558.1 hypothetical protein [Paramoeba pemaquidensis]